MPGSSQSPPAPERAPCFGHRVLPTLLPASARCGGQWDPSLLRAASIMAGKLSSVVVPVQTGWGTSPCVRGPSKACMNKQAPCHVLGQVLPSAKEGEMKTTPCHPTAAVTLGNLPWADGNSPWQVAAPHSLHTPLPLDLREGFLSDLVCLARPNPHLPWTPAPPAARRRLLE